MSCAMDMGFDDMEMPMATIPLAPPLSAVCNNLNSPVLEADQLICPLTRADLYVVHPPPGSGLVRGIDSWEASKGTSSTLTASTAPCP
jgi:hypothetical protein